MRACEKKEKVLEDKTFGMKNKKGTKAQKFIANVEKQVQGGGNPQLKKLEEERAKATENVAKMRRRVSEHR